MSNQYYYNWSFHIIVFVTQQTRELIIIKSMFCTFLLPSNDVWGKLMFLHLSVILLTGGGLCVSQHAMEQGVCDQGVCDQGAYTPDSPPTVNKQGGVHGRGTCCLVLLARGYAWQGACVAGGMHGRGCAWQGDMLFSEQLNLSLNRAWQAIIKGWAGSVFNIFIYYNSGCSSINS